MSRKHLLILAALTAIVVGVALVISRVYQPGSASVVGERLYPGLEARLNEVDKVVAHTGGHPPVTLQLKDGRWLVTDRAGYPADTSKLRQDLLILARMELIEAKTRESANYALLGVMDPKDIQDEETQSLQLFDAQAHELAHVIVGKAGLSGNNYVRRAGEAQTWLASTALRTPKDAAEWLERDLFDVVETRVRSVQVKPAAGEAYEVSHESSGQEFMLKPAPTGRMVSQSDVMRLVRSFKGMRLDDVMADAEADKSPDPWTQLDMSTYDGLLVHAQIRKLGDMYQLRAQAETIPATMAAPAATAVGADAAKPAVDPRSEAAAISERLKGWTYMLAPYRGAPMLQSLENLLKPVDTTTH